MYIYTYCINHRIISIVTLLLLVCLCLIQLYNTNHNILYTQISTTTESDNLTYQIKQLHKHTIETATTGSIFELHQIHTVDSSILYDTLSVLDTHHTNKYTYNQHIHTKLHTCVHPISYHKQYAVVTTIATEPTPGILQLAQTQQWCIIIIGDTKSPDTFNEYIRKQQQSTDKHISTVYNQLVYFSIDDQLQLPYQLIHYTPLSSFSRKNIGFLLAIDSDASVIYDFDDDNVFVPDSLPDTMRHQSNDSPYVIYSERDFRQQPNSHVQSLHSINADHVKPEYHTTSHDIRMRNAHNGNGIYYNLQRSSMLNDIVQTRVLNPYPQFGLLDAWPRGYPLEAVHQSIQSQSTQHTYEHTYRTCTPVIQQLGQGYDPDVDGIYRLTKGVPNDFIPFDKTKQSYTDNKDNVYSNILAVPSGIFTPYAQATIHLPSSFYSMLLPHTVHGRVSDIWRSYIVQTLLTYNDNECVVFTPPHILHQRNSHDYTRDYNSETPLYQQTSALLHMLQQRFHGNVYDIDQHIHPVLLQYKDRIETPMLRLAQLYIDLYEVGILGEADIQYVLAWIVDHTKVHTVMPVQGKQQTERAVCIMFNFAARIDSLWPLVTVQHRLHQHITIISDDMLDNPYTLPYNIHRIQCNSAAGYRQHLCAGECMRYYTDDVNGLAQYNPSATTIQGVFWQSDDSWLNTTQLLSLAWPTAQAWLPVAVFSTSTDQVDVSHRYVLLNDVKTVFSNWVWWDNQDLGGIDGVKTMLQYLYTQSHYAAVLQQMYNNTDSLNEPTLADNWYVPRCGAIEYSHIIESLLSAPDSHAAVSFGEMVIHTLLNLAVHAGNCTDITIRSPHTAYLWNEHRSADNILNQLGADMTVIHPMKLSDTNVRQIYVDATNQLWKQLK